jgi:hypothetical protein
MVDIAFSVRAAKILLQTILENHSLVGIHLLAIVASTIGLCGLTKVWQEKPDLLMPLHKDRIKLTDKRLIACSNCSAVANVSIESENVKLICPNCHMTLGSWETTPAASADITAFLGKRDEN